MTSMREPPLATPQRTKTEVCCVFAMFDVLEDARLIEFFVRGDTWNVPRHLRARRLSLRTVGERSTDLRISKD